MTEQQTRNDLRRKTLQARDELSSASRHCKSVALIDLLRQLPPFALAEHIFTYINFRSEVETLSLVEQCLTAGKVISVPLTLINESRLLACKLTDPESELRPGYCQIPEPDPALALAVNPSDIEVVILPGSVFDEHGGRLGYGGGYYDRFLANDAPQALRIGVAFEMQISGKKLPLLPHDKMLHYLVTEKRILDFQGEKYD
jgi:5-formyltetrahydrofolate cyclo-ligase